MVILRGKRKNLTTPPNNPGPKCRGEILIYIPWQKRYLILGQNCFFFIPPTLHPQINGQEYSYKNLYIYQGKKDGYSQGKTRKL
jgi:hypothetical protein